MSVSRLMVIMSQRIFHLFFFSLSCFVTASVFAFSVDSMYFFNIIITRKSNVLSKLTTMQMNDAFHLQKRHFPNCTLLKLSKLLLSMAGFTACWKYIHHQLDSSLKVSCTNTCRVKSSGRCSENADTEAYVCSMFMFIRRHRRHGD